MPGSIGILSLFTWLLALNAWAGSFDGDRMAGVLDAQPDDVKARYIWRHPQETLEFFGVAPGSAVVEALPGGGWYSKILLPYLGPEGDYVGADYAADMYALFGFFNEQQLKDKETWVADFTAESKGWAGEDGPATAAFVLGSLPDDMKDSAETVLFIRALHNLARFESQGGFLTAAVKSAFDVLKPGGVVGVVQHEARPDMPDDWANGSNGYLKKAFVIQVFTDAGFEFVGDSDVNQNEYDQPTTDDKVWRLPPTLATSRNDPELKKKMEAIGESNRMTLKFRKPM